ncbi:MAG: helix-turn-helix domain-containing protein [Clostridia bacterium]|nr:helix-turn-helix domain-containing protein [Clostridia bacterium]
MTSKECGNFIAELRKENKLTQKELAAKINVSDKAVSRWETGKGYPDVTSLVSLSEYFGVSVNELLAGKRLSIENIKETADENLISVFEQVQKNKRKQIAQTALYTVVFLVILSPALSIIFKEFFATIYKEVKTENVISAIIPTVIALILLVVGCFIRKGNLSILHSYHYKNVADLKGYAKEMGNGIIFMSMPIFLYGFFSLFVHIKTVSIISAVVLFSGIIGCVVYLFKVQTKYNGSLF